MNKTTGLLLACACALAACDLAEPTTPEGGAEAEFERGPNNGRLLTDGDFTLELAIFEAGVRILSETNDEALVFGVTMPLNASRRARNDIAVARAEREQTTAERDAHRVRAAAELFELFQELRHAITEADMLRTTVLPEMEAALEATRYAFERGRYSYLEWVDAQRELVDVQRALIDASANAHLYRTEIERLTDEPLSGEEDSP